mgnify:CR=1 FL=1
MLKVFYRIGTYLAKAAKGLTGGTHPAQVVGLTATTLTLGSVWDTITGWFGGNENQGVTPDEEDEQSLWEKLEELANTGIIATITAGILFVVLLLVLGQKSLKRQMR